MPIEWSRKTRTIYSWETEEKKRKENQPEFSEPIHIDPQD
jgi:hypothetical protein